MIQSRRQVEPQAIAARTRAAALHTAIGAAILLYLGYSYSEPSREDLAGWSLWILFQTLRIGGIVSATAAILLMTGWRHALLIDGIIACAVGVILIVTALGWMSGGLNIQAIVSVIGGMMFASSGWRSAREYFLYSAASAPAEVSISDDGSRPIIPAPPSKEVFISAKAVEAPAPKARVVPPVPLTSPASPPPAEGYLAALARKTPQDPDHSAGSGP